MNFPFLTDSLKRIPPLNFAKYYNYSFKNRFFTGQLCFISTLIFFLRKNNLEYKNIIELILKCYF